MPSLSFKQKLIALIVITLVGILCIVLVAFSTLRSLDKSASRVAELTTTSSLLSSIQLQMVTAESDLSNLTGETADKFSKQLSNFSKQVKPDFDQAIASAGDEQLAEFLTTTQKSLATYKTAISSEIEASKALGFDEKSGLLLQLHQAANKLDEDLSTFSMLHKPFIIARQLEKEFLLVPDESHTEKLKQQVQNIINTVKEAEFYDTFGTSIESYRSALDLVIDAAREKEQSSIEMLDLRNQFSKQNHVAQTYVNEDLLVKAKSHAQKTSTNSSWTLGIVSALVAIIVSGALITISFQTTRTLKQIISHLGEIAKGNLSSPVLTSKNSNDEFSQVIDAANITSDKLKTLIGEMINSQQTLNNQANDLQSSVQTIAANNATIAEQSNTISLSTEQISSTAEQVASNTQSLTQDTSCAHQSAVSGGQTIEAMIKALETTSNHVEASSAQLTELQAHSKQIDSVLEIINGLADQTNLLALNAAIEAARAGDAGRGFSVVADEVRSLASRTVSATSEITETVRAIQKQTDKVLVTMEQSCSSIGSVKEQSDAAKLAIDEIESQTRQASETSLDINHSMDQVAMTTRDMAQNMEQVSQVIGLNKDASDTIVNSSENLVSQANAIGGMTQKFNI